MEGTQNTHARVKQSGHLSISPLSSARTSFDEQRNVSPHFPTTAIDDFFESEANTPTFNRQPDSPTRLDTARTADDEEWDDKKGKPRVTIRSETDFSRTSTLATRSPNHSSTTLSSKKEKITSFVAYWEDKWAFEIFCCIFALLNLVAMIITLAAHQDKPLPQWPGLISINSLVSVFGALMKAAIAIPVAEGEASTLFSRASTDCYTK